MPYAVLKETNMSNMEKLLNAVKKANSGFSKDKEDDVFFYPVRDAVGNGSAVIRFLPTEDADDVPFVKLYTHGFKNATSGKWLIDNCPTTLEADCPICAANSVNYNTMSKEDARKLGMNRKVSYITRVLVVEDKKTPENEGKVFLYKFGQKIFDKIVDKLQPEFEDDKPCNIFDLVEGADFKLKIRKVDGQTNYDKSEFSDPSECEVKVFKQFTPENDIQKFLKPENFKSAEKLQARLDLVMGKASPAKPAAKSDEDKSDEDKFEQIAKPEAKPSTRKEVVKEEDDDEGDDIMALVKSLAKED